MGRTLNEAEFEALVENLLASDPVESFGRLHVVTLADSRDDPDWKRKLPKFRAIAEAVLKARLARDEAFFPSAPGQYVLVLGRLGEAEGAVRAAAIAREIRGRLFGETGRDREVTARIVPLARWGACRSGGRAEGGPAAGPSAKAPGRHGIRLDAMFQPIWDALGETVIGNRETIRRIFETREIVGPAVLFGGEDDPLALEVNAVLRRGAGAGVACRATLFLAQVVNSLVMRDIAPIREWVAEAVRHHRDEVVVELTGGVAAVGRPRLRDLIRTIRAAGASVAVQTFPDMETARIVRELGVRYLCVDEAQVRVAGLSPSAIMALFTVIAHEVRSLGLHLCLWNVKTPQEIKRAIPLGFRYFSGGAIGDMSRLPAEPCLKSAEQVFA